MNSVMIVDDSESDQFLTKVIIEKLNPDIRILQAYDGQEALEILADLPKPPDVIFLDINMPRMNGHEFLENYKACEEQTVVVIMLTSSDQERDKEKSMVHKCVKKYLTKPLHTPALKAIIHALPQKS